MTDYHISSTGDDATGDGSEGSPWKTWAKVMSTFEGSSGGDSILFKRGETHDSSGSSAIFNSNISDTSRVTFGAYGTGDDPIISPVDGSIPFYFNSYADYDGDPVVPNDGGVNFENLHFKSPTRGSCSRAIWLFNGFSWVTVDGCTIDGFTAGINMGKGNALSANGVKLLNTTIKNCEDNGFYGGANGLIVDNCIFDNNGYENPSLGHNVYLAETNADNTPLTNTRVTNNTFTRNAQQYQDVIDLGTDDFSGTPATSNTVTGNTSGATGTIDEITATEMVIKLPDADLSTRFQVGETVTVTEGALTSTGNIGVVNPWDKAMSVNLVMHGRMDGIVVRDNNFFQEKNSVTGAFASPQGFGIGIGPGYGGETEAFTNVVVQGNEVINQGGAGIFFTSASDVEISNNRVTVSSRFSNAIQADRSDDEATVTNNINVLDNTIIVDVDPRIDATKSGVVFTDIVDGSIKGNVFFINDANAANRAIRAAGSIDLGTENQYHSFTSPLGTATNTIS